MESPMSRDAVGLDTGMGAEVMAEDKVLMSEGVCGQAGTHDGYPQSPRDSPRACRAVDPASP